MTIDSELQARSENKCELCGSTETLSAFEVTQAPDTSSESSAYLCTTCQDQITTPATADTAHWQCLSESMWSEAAAVKVLAWRMLRYLRSESWAQDLLDMLYLEDEVLAWAEAGEMERADSGDVQHMDSNGAALLAGDTVVLIKDLNVKGAGFTAKRGTAVRGISLVPDNAEHIEGRINGQQIVILTKFVKKSG
ncbi:PhnA protein [Alphaproteobacteria bacterium 46_93_T64]|nr:PhnA protein [Alphaproteobacteria bacterium 46_93_T64]